MADLDFLVAELTECQIYLTQWLYVLEPDKFCAFYNGQKALGYATGFAEEL